MPLTWRQYHEWKGKQKFRHRGLRPVNSDEQTKRTENCLIFLFTSVPAKPGWDSSPVKWTILAMLAWEILHNKMYLWLVRPRKANICYNFTHKHEKESLCLRLQCLYYLTSWHFMRHILKFLLYIGKRSVNFYSSLFSDRGLLDILRKFRTIDALVRSHSEL